jgi:hypothetical protein
MEILDCSRIDVLNVDPSDPGLLNDEQLTPEELKSQNKVPMIESETNCKQSGLSVNNELEKSTEHINNNNNNNIEENSKIDDKFSCSTPIKFLLEESNSYNYHDENDQLNNIKMSENFKFGVKLADHAKQSNSLAEFEENERRVQSLTSDNKDQASDCYDEEIEKLAYNSTSYLSMLDEPINQMQELLFNLRSNYNYQNSNDFYGCKENALHATNKIEFEKEPISNIKKIGENFGINTQTDSQTLLFLKHQRKQAKQLETEKQELKSPKNLISMTPLTLDYARKNDGLIALENRLENERLRRLHCEKQIFELNEHLLELQEQLAIAYALDKKRELFAQNMDTSLHKVK